MRGPARRSGFYYDAATGAPAARRWQNGYLNFDNLPNALVALFVISTLDGTAARRAPLTPLILPASPPLEPVLSLAREV